MRQLSEGELWDRVKALEGSTVETLERGEPSKISEVTESTAKRVDPKTGIMKTSAKREDVWGVYSYLWDRGFIVSEKDGFIPGKTRDLTKNGRFILSILEKALPDQIVSFKRKDTGSPWPGKSGLKLR